MNKIISFVKSPRFISGVEHLAAIGAVAVLSDLSAHIDGYGLNNFEVVVGGIALNHAIGALNAWLKNNPTGLTA